MAVQFNEDKKIFRLDTETSTYLMGLTPEGYLGHIYYGDRLYKAAENYMLRMEEPPYTPSVNKREKSSFLDSFPMEYPTGGIGDYRESCLEGTHARDKDAVVAVMALCEVAAYYKSKGITLCEQMEKLYQKYGFYKESLFFQTFPGAEGKAKIDGLMDALRNQPPKQVGPFKVTALEDYKKSVRTDIATGETSALTLPESNVLYFELEDGAWFCVRPSGTEPKIKYYAGVKGAR